MDANNVLPSDREHAERIAVPKVVLSRERKTAQVVYRRDVRGVDVDEALSVVGDPLLDVRNQRAQSLRLQRA
jgi:hypothetical protein